MVSVTLVWSEKNSLYDMGAHVPWALRGLARSSTLNFDANIWIGNTDGPHTLAVRTTSLFGTFVLHSERQNDMRLRNI